ncbi:MAG TPA: hypothetical protein VKB79_07835 [Bryobacteraceae bacterium]|nr:hypothetical protein [Bryobacteraceae bacterium]
MGRSLGIGLALVAALGAQTSDLPPNVLFLSRAMRHIRQTITAVPNFTCTETIYREQLTPPSKKFEQLDVVRLEVAKVGSKEVFAWPGARRFEEKPAASFVAGGMIGDGIFSAFGADLFLHSLATMDVVGPEEISGRKAIRVNYVVGPLHASFSIHTELGSATVSYSGSFWVDPESFDLIRLSVRADDIPAALQLSSVLINADFAILEGAALPQSAVMQMARASGSVSRDQIGFAGCRKFTGDTRISFDSAEPDAGPVETLPVRSPTTLPGDLEIPLRLTTEVNVNTSKVGDEVSALIEGDVKRGHQTWLRKGSVAYGRIRRLERRKGRPDYVLLGLEFSEAEAGQERVEFVARLKSIPGTQGSMLRHLEEPEDQPVLNQGRLVTEKSWTEAFDPPMAGVGYLYLNSEPFRLPAGVRMVWQTQAIRQSDRR